METISNDLKKKRKNFIRFAPFARATYYSPWINDIFVYEKFLRWRLLGISHKTHNSHTRFSAYWCTYYVCVRVYLYAYAVMYKVQVSTNREGDREKDKKKPFAR